MKKVIAFLGRLGTTKILLIVALVASIAWGVDLSCRISETQTQLLAAQNLVAEKDSLRKVVETQYITISERYAFQGRDLDVSLKANLELRKRITERDGKLQSLAVLLEEARLTNVTLRGILAKDSVGEYAQFDSTNEDYYIRAQARLRPVPQLLIQDIVMTDSTSAGIYTIDNGMAVGFVTHSNKHIADKGGEFHFRVPDAPRSESWHDSPYVKIGAAVALIVFAIL